MKSLKKCFLLLLSMAMVSIAVPAYASDAADEHANEAEQSEQVEQGRLSDLAIVSEKGEEIKRDNGVFDKKFEKGGLTETIKSFGKDTGIYKFSGDKKVAEDKDPLTNTVDWRCAVMLLISFVLLYLAIVKKFEPLLLLPIAFGMLLTNQVPICSTPISLPMVMLIGALSAVVVLVFWITSTSV